MSNVAYTIAKGLLNTVDWTDASKKYRVLLATSDYVPDASHQYVADVTDEASGVGYARKLLGSRTRAIDSGNVLYKAAASSWTLLTSDFQWAIVYYDVDGSDGNDATAWLVCALDLGSQSIVTALYTLNYGAANPGAVFEVD